MIPKNNKGKNKIQYGYNTNVFRLHVNNSGPQKQIVYALRFPVSCKDLQLVSKRGDFLSYFEWMGEMREYGLRPIVKDLIELSKKGRYTVATLSADLNIYDLLKMDDVIESRMWVDEISGFNKLYRMSFDWLRFLDDNTYERIAQSNIVVACVEILGHGEAALIEPPKFIFSFLNSMGPISNERKPLAEYKMLFQNTEFGDLIKGYKRNPRLLWENSYHTTLENSNFVGNIYFSNYGRWINKTKDLFLFKSGWNFFRQEDGFGEFITLECKVRHLKEAMPFDHIVVKLYLVEVYEMKILLRYEIFKQSDISNDAKLAVFNQTIVFLKYDKGVPCICDIPQEGLDIFLEC